MKFYISVLTLLFFVSCAKTPPADNGASENLRARNKETAAKNEVNTITREFQLLEKQGRAMDLFRNQNNAENDRECNAAMEKARQKITELETRAAALPDNYKSALLPIIPDLNECVSCSKKAAESCIKARASINQAIKNLFPQ